MGFEYDLPTGQSGVVGLKSGPAGGLVAHHETRQRLEELSKTVSEIAAIIKSAQEAPDGDPLKQINEKLDRLAEQNKLLVQALTELTTLLKALRPQAPSAPPLPRVSGLAYQRTR